MSIKDYVNEDENIIEKLDKYDKSIACTNKRVIYSKKGLRNNEEKGIEFNSIESLGIESKVGIMNVLYSLVSFIIVLISLFVYISSKNLFRSNGQDLFSSYINAISNIIGILSIIFIIVSFISGLYYLYNVVFNRYTLRIRTLSGENYVIKSTNKNKIYKIKNCIEEKLH